MHIFAVNRQEALLCKLIGLAMRRGEGCLSEEEARAVFSVGVSAHAVFFAEMASRPAD